MPTVRKTSGGRVYYRAVGREFAAGETADVDDDTAAYLCDERGEFERVENGESEDDLEAFDGVGPQTADALREAGYDTPDDVRNADAGELTDVDGVSESLADDLTSEGGG